MARNVYFDPFGQRTEGYRAGVQDESALQGATRAARGIDWDYNNMAPIRLGEAQLAYDYNKFATPYNQKVLQRADVAGDIAQAAGVANRSGNTRLIRTIDQNLEQGNY